MRLPKIIIRKIINLLGKITNLNFIRFTQNKYLKIHKFSLCQIRKSYTNHFFKTDFGQKIKIIKTH